MGKTLLYLLVLIISASGQDNSSFPDQNISSNDSLILKSYKVIEGDWLSKIAAKTEFYNDPMKWPVIYQSNRDVINNPDFIFPGQILKIPRLVNNEYSLESLEGIKKDTTLKNIPLKTEDIEYQGFIVDETQSKWGKEFFEMFYDQFQSRGASSNFIIVITEKPLPRLGSQISIKVSDAEIFQQYIQPKEENLEETAQYAVDYTINYIDNYEVIEKSMQGGDMKGTGIF